MNPGCRLKKAASAAQAWSNWSTSPGWTVKVLISTTGPASWPICSCSVTVASISFSWIMASPPSGIHSLTCPVSERLFDRLAGAESTVHLHRFDHLAHQLGRHVVGDQEGAHHANGEALARFALLLEMAAVVDLRPDAERQARGDLPHRFAVPGELVVDRDADEFG